MGDKPVVKKWKDKTEVWHNNSAGNTTKEGHRTTSRKTGNTVDHYGKIVGKNKKK